MQYKDREHGDDAVQKGNGGVRHGNAGKFCNQQGDDQLKGLHFADLALSHQPHDDEQHRKDDGGADDDEDHTKSMRHLQKGMSILLPFSVNGV